MLCLRKVEFLFYNFTRNSLACQDTSKNKRTALPLFVRGRGLKNLVWRVSLAVNVVSNGAKQPNLTDWRGSKLSTQQEQKRDTQKHIPLLLVIGAVNKDKSEPHRRVIGFGSLLSPPDIWVPTLSAGLRISDFRLHERWSGLLKYY